MSANRVQYFIRSILQNSKLNRVNFVNTKKSYKLMNVKNINHNMIIKRKFGSSSGYIPPSNANGPNNGPNNGPDWKAFIVMISGIYVINQINKK